MSIKLRALLSSTLLIAACASEQPEAPPPAPQPVLPLEPAPAPAPVEAAPAPAPVPAPAPAPLSKAWNVVATSDATADAATRSADNLSKKGYQVEVQTAEVKGVTWHRAVITGIKTFKQARQLVATLDKDGIKGAWVQRASAKP